jgi:hypothetical protein
VKQSLEREEDGIVMGCDSVVVASTASQGGKTTVSWLKFTMTDLAWFLVILVQDGNPTTFDAKATDLSLTVDYAAKPSCKATVTPKDANGPVNDKASFAAPVPFPPPPIDPAKKRPIIIRACADDTSVTVNWVASTIDDLEGNYLSIVENSTKLMNFKVEGAGVVAYTANYTCHSDSFYEVIITPYDWEGPLYTSASYPAPISYP